MSLTQIVPTDTFSQWAEKTNAAIATISSLSPSSLEVISVSTPSDGQLLRYSTGTSFFNNVTLYGTTNQVSISSGATGITLSLPQNIHTGATPTFAGIVLSSPLGIAYGGTGSTGATGALTALLPSQATASGKVLSSNGTYAVWVSTTVEPGGVDTEVQFRDSTSFAGASGLKYNKTTKLVTVETKIVSPIYGATGVISFIPGIDSAGAFKILSSAGASSVFSVNTSGSYVGINTATPGYALDVLGDVNISSGKTYKGAGTTILTAAGQLAIASQPNITSLGTLSSVTVSGAATLNTVNASGAVVLASTLGATGAVTFASTLNVTGAAIFSSTVAVTGLLTGRTNVVNRGTSLNPAVVQTIYAVTASSITFTLPGSPTAGDIVGFRPVTSSINSYTVARNGNNIMGLAEDLTVDSAIAFDLLYTSSGWILS